MIPLRSRIPIAADCPGGEERPAGSGRGMPTSPEGGPSGRAEHGAGGTVWSEEEVQPPTRSRSDAGGGVRCSRTRPEGGLRCAASRCEQTRRAVSNNRGDYTMAIVI
ncbi:hypothetical protein [Methanofollis fontis]|uniref:hypothetical protein n=1 Tax=Methanofollis fontis TaxID=2052832 RepID=UPI00102ED578|nr:hypothetical protein [Methanofollis fontis]